MQWISVWSMQMLINPSEPWVRTIHFTSSQSPGAFLLSWECSKDSPVSSQAKQMLVNKLCVELAIKWLLHALFLGSWKNVFEVYLESLVLETQLFSWVSGRLWSKRMHHSLICLFIYLFWLAHGHWAGTSLVGVRRSFSCCGAWFLECVDSVVAALGLSYPTACGIFVPRSGIEASSPALEGRFFSFFLPLFSKAES